MEEEGPPPKTSLIKGNQLRTNWDDVICPICLYSPHNCVLLKCSSYDKGCRPFICDTNQLHSNCLDRYKEANGIPASSRLCNFPENQSEPNNKPACPLCRGEVTGWTVVENARMHFDVKIRFCAEEDCSFKGTYLELQKHAEEEHPQACPSMIDPARRLDWENFQRSSDLVDVLTTIQSEVPNGIILGDYVVEYGEDNNSGDDGDDVQRDEGKWWRSCIFYQIFGGFATSRNRRRSSAGNSGRGRRRSSNSDEGSVSSGENVDNNGDDGEAEIAGARELSNERAVQRSSRRHLSRFSDN